MSYTSENTAADASTTPASHGEVRGARTGTVVWGFIILGVAALAFTARQWDLSEYHPGVITAWVAVGLGGLAIVGGLIAALFRRR
ncbi:MAG TPA: hypothetical protein PK781_10960 [Terrimesophilobacter sp.]|nr:hypothetical protein [Terrimesophilobacter sp.]HRQ00957.1 hypothetical protein [Terrimesophilobacter sp.]